MYIYTHLGQFTLTHKYWLVAHRWLKACGVHLASENHLRDVSKRQLGTNLAGEAAPFSFAVRSGGEDLRPAPFVFIPDLIAKVVQLLEQNKR